MVLAPLVSELTPWTIKEKPRAHAQGIEISLESINSQESNLEHTEHRGLGSFSSLTNFVAFPRESKQESLSNWT